MSDLRSNIRQHKRRERKKAAGWVEKLYWVHADDVDILTEFNNLLKSRRTENLDTIKKATSAQKLDRKTLGVRTGLMKYVHMYSKSHQ